MAFSIIQCGSTARGDANLHSDVDVICIWSGSSPAFSLLVEKYGELAFYSLETMRRMRSKGSLFLTHLDVDGIFIDGDESLFEEFRGFRPSVRQVRTLYKETARAVTSLEWFPNSALGELWLCDILYVALRTCLYCKNAIKGVYTFGYLDAMKAYGLNADQIATMLLLREGKYRYRASAWNSAATKLGFDSGLAKQACFAILAEAVDIARGGKTDWAKLSECPRDYWSERLIERAILNKEHQDDEFMMKMKLHNYNKRSLRSDISRIVRMHTFSV
ncbi:hypothetical protein HU727_006135 [Pseudomonas sp. SWRI153]|uniref:Nucleotidyltransferase domain-containing protein n=1 Tax=Pseudomonas khorasanensis TaxID=2745508 RepID=A0A923F1U9_9PSED|nr:hypothetical protein [Pseudomonas khorasanensis]MBV4485163.1 hypothetical protein [Pseudomonas khorasanensis]